MVSKKTRRKQHRRDRRKAKESGFNREGKTKIGRIGHGSTGGPMSRLEIKPVKKSKPLTPQQEKNIIKSVKLLNSSLSQGLNIPTNKEPEELTDEELGALLDIVDWAYNEDK